MSELEEQNDKKPDGKGAEPTRSFDSSTLRPGGRIGAFRIERELGRGAAGVVYLAHDTKLDRSVAIKSLPAELMENPKARTRFSREARLLASVNHPNIATIHEVLEEAEGLGYLILEYVPGQTLAERISGTKLQLQEVLSIAQQIAEAVAAAHEHDVIHRDLKPGNIKITPEGKVKVLDFGLAKALGGDSADQQSTITEPGRIIGTPAYMSPEQARGQPTDKRCDIWSFGCVLYEMLTGKVPFEGETVSDTLANILQTDPDWQSVPESTPANIQILLRRCLEKDPRQRLRDIGDALIEVKDTLSVSATASIISAPLVGKSRPAFWRWAVICGLTGLIVGLIAASLFFRSSAEQSISHLAPPPGLRTQIMLPDDQVLGVFHSTVFGVRQPAFDLSPDGLHLVYVANSDTGTQLILRPMNQFEATRAISGTEGASVPFFSPDGQSVGFFAGEKLKVVSLEGGEPVTICDAGFPQTGTWGNDGMIYFTGGHKGGISRVPDNGGESELLGTLSETFTGVYPQVLPGNKALLISSNEGAVLVSLETMEKKLIVKDALFARYVPTGHLVYIHAGAIRAIPFNLTTHKVTEPSVLVLENVLTDSEYGSAQFAFSNNGLLVYVPGIDIARTTIPTWVDRQGNEEPLDMRAQYYGTPKLSPDGSRLAIVVQGLRSDVYVYDIANGMETRLTKEGNNISPVWTPDGERIAFSTGSTEQKRRLFWKAADGSGEAELLCPGQYGLSPSSWSPNGKLLVLYSSDLGICILSLDRPGEVKPFRNSDFTEVQAVFSPDGRYIAFTSNKDGDFNVYVCPYPDMDWIRRISPDFGEEPIWSAKGDELFYRNRNKWMAVSITTKPEFKAYTPYMVFEGRYINVSGFSYDVSPDGRRFLVLRPEYDDSQEREFRVVSNWFEDLKRRVPAGKTK